MKQNLFRVIINEDKKRKLNVWVDNAAHQQVFMQTCNSLKDFSFEFTEAGIVYYKNI